MNSNDHQFIIQEIIRFSFSRFISNKIYLVGTLMINFKLKHLNISHKSSRKGYNFNILFNVVFGQLLRVYINTQNAITSEVLLLLLLWLLLPILLTHSIP